MSGIPSNMNVVGNIMQSQVSSNDKAKTDQTAENQKTHEKRQMVRITEQQTDEVEKTEATDDVYVRREDERQRDGRDARDTWEHHKKERLYHESEDEFQGKENDKDAGQDEENKINPTDEEGGCHIDVSI